MCRVGRIIKVVVVLGIAEELKFRTSCRKGTVEGYIREEGRKRRRAIDKSKSTLHCWLVKILLTARKQDRHYLPRKSSGCKGCMSQHDSCIAKGLPKPWLLYLVMSRISHFPLQLFHEA
jgi:hypothetical protein